MENERKPGILLQVVNIRFVPGKEIVETDDLVSFVEQSAAKVGTDETGATGYENFFHILRFNGYVQSSRRLRLRIGFRATRLLKRPRGSFNRRRISLGIRRAFR